MSNTAKTRRAARLALETYMRERGFNSDNGDRSNTQDLLVDLAHLADTFTGDEETGGAALLDDAIDVYTEETECEGHESLNGSEMGQTVYCDGSCRREN